MKDSLDLSMQHAGSIRHELCSEKCDTCFKNRGCIYDQYLFPAILNKETLQQLRSSMNTAAQQAVKEHKIISNAAAA